MAAPVTDSRPKADLRDFSQIWAGQFVSLVGSSLTSFALGVWVFLETGSTTQLGLIYMLTFVPGILVAPFAGTIVDRINRGTALLISNWGGLACMAGLAALYYTGLLHPWQIYIATAALSIVRAVQFPAFAASTTVLVPPEHLGRANGRVMLAQGVSQVIGPLAAGVLITTIGLGGLLLIDSLTYGFAILTLLAVCIPSPAASTEGSAGGGSLLGEAAQSWHYITGRAGLLRLLLFYAALNFSVGFVDVLITPLVLSFARTTALGIVLALAGIGVIAGSVVMSVWGGPSRRIHGVLTFTLLLGLAVCLGALLPNVTLIATAAFIFSFCSAVINGSSTSIWQRKVQPDLQGRVLSFESMVATSTLPVAYLLAGPLTDHVFEPLLVPHGRLAGTAGAVVGVGHGRGIAFLLLLLGVLTIIIGAAGYLQPRLRNVEIDLPDAVVDVPAGDPPSVPVPAAGSGGTGMRAASRLAGLPGAIGAVVTSAAVLGLLAFGFGPIPALGSALDPGRGAWTSAADGRAVTSQTLHLPGLDQPVEVSFTKDGLASINASDTHDLFLATGYVEAKFRLSEMDLERRLGEGQLAQLAGASDTASDEFELRLGLLRTAQNEWARTTGAARAALLAYAQGVNSDIAQVRAAGDWPAEYSLAGVYPREWTPVDSLVVQGVLTQQLNFTAEPLDDELLEQSLGPARTMDWFPVEQANTWTAYDTGPYVKEPLTPVAAGFASSAPAGAGPTAVTSSTEGRGSGPAGSRGGSGKSASAVTAAAAQLLAALRQFPAQQVHEYPDSNAWAANGPAVAGGGALLGGDPHLPQTLPSVWYEVALSAPGYQVSGVGLPGVPGVLLGHNAHIAWSLTDTQNQSTLYYAEQVRGDEYFWRGQWRKMTVAYYTIPVRGGPSVQLAVDITADGPIMTQYGQTMAVDWMGNVSSNDMEALLEVNQATDFAQFKAALSGWLAPTQNFVYADTAGNIGAISAGYYPEVSSSCQPWLAMTGAGACDVTGVIPYNAIPQTYDPPSHLIVTANQRPVTAAYPYYIGTSNDFFDPGYRAAYAYQALQADEPLSSASIAALQNSLTDSLAASIVPKLLAAVGSSALDSTERSVVSELSSWNDSMDAGSAAATVWSKFLDNYLSAVFSPWWTAAKVPASKDPPGLDVSADLSPLVEDLQQWTLTDPGNPAFRGPRGNGYPGAQAAMVAAFKKRCPGCRRRWAVRRRRGPGAGCSRGSSRRCPARPGWATARAPPAATRSSRTRRTAAPRRQPARAGAWWPGSPTARCRPRASIRAGSRRTRRRRGTTT